MHISAIRFYFWLLFSNPISAGSIEIDQVRKVTHNISAPYSLHWIFCPDSTAPKKPHWKYDHSSKKIYHSLEQLVNQFISKMDEEFWIWYDLIVIRSQGTRVAKQASPQHLTIMTKNRIIWT